MSYFLDLYPKAKYPLASNGLFGLHNAQLVPIPLPPFAEQQRIVARVEELLASCDRLK